MQQFFRSHRKFIIQAAVILLIVVLVLIAGSNYYRNITSRNIGIGFGFLDDTAGFSISQTFIPYDESDTFGRTYLVGLLNTLVASFIGIILATVFGFILGLLRLSNNYLAAKTSLGIIELLRNVPPLLQVLFWYQVFFLRILPSLDDAWTLPGGVYISIRGITVPEIHGNANVAIFWAVFLICLAVWIFLSRFKQKEIQEGRHHNFGPYRIGLVALPILLIFFIKPFYVVMPELGRFRFTSGVTLLPELFSIIIALASYTATYIAEIVRSSIIGVSKGQLEAAQSLGFTRGQQLRLIIIPQALRTMVPPVTNQYLNLIKNTSLGVSVAYPDLTAVFAGTTLNQSGRALEIMLMVMLTYLSISLVTSFLMNLYNKKIIDKKGKSIVIEQPGSLEVSA